MGSHCKRRRVMSLAPITAVAVAVTLSTQLVLVSAAAPTKAMSHSMQVVATTAQNSPAEHAFDTRGIRRLQAQPWARGRTEEPVPRGQRRACCKKARPGHWHPGAQQNIRQRRGQRLGAWQQSPP